MRRALLLAFGLGAGIAPAALAAGEATAVRGRLFSDVYLPMLQGNAHDFPELATAGWVEFSPRIDETSSATLILEFNATESAASGAAFANNRAAVNLREGYATYAKNGFEFRMGRQIIPWGKSDGINPTDFLGAKDYTRFNSDEEVKRIGATDLKVTWTPAGGSSPVTFTTVLVPVFARSKLLIPASALPSGVTLLSEAPPRANIANLEYAFKLAYFYSDWDLSLSAFHGWAHAPEFAPGISVTSDPTLTPTYYLVNALGADTSLSSGSWIFRLEAAYLKTPNHDGQNPLIEPTRVEGVLGIEKTFGDKFRAQVQLVERYFPQYLAPDQMNAAPTVATFYRQVAATNALLLGYEEKQKTGLTLRLAYDDEKSGLSAEVFALAYLTSKDYLIRPKFSYAWSDAFKTTAGFEYYGGSQSHPLGLLHDFSSVFVEAKYVF